MMRCECVDLGCESRARKGEKERMYKTEREKEIESIKERERKRESIKREKERKRENKENLKCTMDPPGLISNNGKHSLPVR